MNIYFLRHGDAEDKKPGQTDAERELTSLGMQQARDASRWLSDHGIEVALIVSSPLLRARQTAEPVAAALQAQITEDERLSGGQLTVEALAGIVTDAGNPNSILLVGHEPDFSRTIAALIGGAVDVKKAALALVECDRVAAGGELAWLIPPKLRG